MFTEIIGIRERENEKETELYTQRDRCGTPGRAHLHLKISLISTTRQSDRQQRQTERERLWTAHSYPERVGSLKNYRF